MSVLTQKVWGWYKMKFWKNNKVDQEIDVRPETILREWLRSEEFFAWQSEGSLSLQQSLSDFIISRYGAYEQDDYERLLDYVVRNWRSTKSAIGIGLV